MRSALFFALVLSSAAAANAQALTVVSGTCNLETTGESIVLKAEDPIHHFGVFAEGFSKIGDRIYLSQSFQNSIDIHFQTGDDLGYAIVPLAKTGPTQVRSGVLVKSAKEKVAEWLSCDLLIE